MHRKVTICTASFPPEKGGAPTRIYNLACLLQSAGHEVTVITAMPNYPAGHIFPGYRGRLICREAMNGIRVIRLWLVPSNSGNRLVRALSLVTHLCTLLLMAFPRLLFRKSDLVIISSPPLITAWATALMARVSGRRILVNISDIWPLTATEMGALAPGFLLRTLQRMERQLYRSAICFSGQSQEILDHIAATTPHQKPVFLYRNLQAPGTIPVAPAQPGLRPRVLYAGNLGHAQGMLELCRCTDFGAAGLELHIYGDGAEREALSEWLKQQHSPHIFLHDTISQAALNERLSTFSAVLIPLKTNIHGAVPSKLFLAVAHGLPVLFCGGGEGERLVQEHGLGWTCPPGDYQRLTARLQAFSRLPAADILGLRAHIATVRDTFFSKEKQDFAFTRFLESLL